MRRRKNVVVSLFIAKVKVKAKDNLLDAAILENTKETAKTLTEKSPVIKHLVEKKKVKIAAGVYNMSTGEVELVDELTAAKETGHNHAAGHTASQVK